MNDLAALIQDIHPDDTMRAARPEAYFNTSLSALTAIQRALACAGKQDVRTIMDFGCGYGRVCRALRARWPDAHIVAADLIHAGVDFCAETFAAEALYSTEDLSVKPSVGMDLIWVGSVFTHLPEKAWSAMLRYLIDCLAPDGVLVFTTHGRAAQWVFEYHSLAKSHITAMEFDSLKADYNDCGFGFLGYTPGMIKHIREKTRAGVTEQRYGLSFSRPDWVCKTLTSFPEVILSGYAEGGWGKNHDVVAVCKTSDLRAPSPLEK